MHESLVSFSAYLFGIMAKRLLKILGLKSNSCESDLKKTDEETETIDDIVIFENIQTPRSDKSLVVNLLKKTHEKRICDQNQTTNGDVCKNGKDQARAPICGAESNLTMASAQSLPNFKSKNKIVVNC